MNRERAVLSYLAGEMPAQKLPGAKVEALAIVLVEIPTAVSANVDAQGKRTGRRFVCALSERGDRYNTALANIDRQLCQPWGNQQRLVRLPCIALFEITRSGLSAAVEALSGPVIEPDSRRQIDFIWPDLFW